MYLTWLCSKQWTCPCLSPKHSFLLDPQSHRYQMHNAELFSLTHSSYRDKVTKIDDVLARGSLEILKLKIARVNHIKVYNKVSQYNCQLPVEKKVARVINHKIVPEVWVVGCRRKQRCHAKKRYGIDKPKLSKVVGVLCYKMETSSLMLTCIFQDGASYVCHYIVL